MLGQGLHFFLIFLVEFLCLECLPFIDLLSDYLLDCPTHNSMTILLVFLTSGFSFILLCHELNITIEGDISERLKGSSMRRQSSADVRVPITNGLRLLMILLPSVPAL